MGNKQILTKILATIHVDEHHRLELPLKIIIIFVYRLNEILYNILYRPGNVEKKNIKNKKIKFLFNYRNTLCWVLCFYYYY